MRKEVVLSLFIIIILNGSFIFTIYVLKNNNNDEKTNKIYEPNYNYIVDIVSNSSTLFIPIPYEKNEPLFNISEYVIIKGKGSINYTHTKYGFGMEIITKGNITIKVENHFKILSHFSMGNETILFNNSKYEGKPTLYWIFYKGETNAYININCWEKTYHSGFPHFHLRGILISGWNKVYGEYGSVRN